MPGPPDGLKTERQGEGTMPAKEWDPEDPYEWTAVLLPTREDTSVEMAEVFVEEFLRMHYGARQVLALFRNPHYRGPHGVWCEHGDEFVRALITRVFLQWGRIPDWDRAAEPAARLPGPGRTAGESVPGEPVGRLRPGGRVEGGISEGQRP